MDLMASAIDLVVDTSALAAILLGEPEAPQLLAALMAAPRVGLCAANRSELFIVIQARLGDVGVAHARALLAALRIETVALDEGLADLAAEGFRRFGKGRHPAGLNFGDCFSYALALHVGVPLLFKGRDFDQTDVQVAAWAVP